LELEVDFTDGRLQIRHSRPGTPSPAQMRNLLTSTLIPTRRSVKCPDPPFAHQVTLPDNTPDVCDMKGKSNFFYRARLRRMKISSKTLGWAFTRAAIAVGSGWLGTDAKNYLVFFFD
jgi:hypothetical protein